MTYKQIFLAVGLLLLLGITSVFLAVAYQKPVTTPNQFAETISATEQRPELHIYGTGVRSYFYLLNIYRGALYLPKELAEKISLLNDGILNQQLAKRMSLNIMMHKISGRKMTYFIASAIRQSQGDKVAAQLQNSFVQLNNILQQPLQVNDQLEFDYIPGVGTDVIKNSEHVGVIKDSSFFQAMLEVWVGQNPVSPHFKQQLLSQE